LLAILIEGVDSMKRKASISHDEATIRELRDKSEFAAEYLRAALEEDYEQDVPLIALRRIGEAAAASPRWPKRRELNARVCIVLCGVGETLGSPRWWP
jgi:hypothetical protein